LRAIGRGLSLKIVEHFLGQTAGIRRRPHHQGRNCADDRGRRHATLPVAREIVDDLASTGRVADVNRSLQIEMRRQGRKVAGVVVHVVAVRGLRRPAVPAAIVSDHAITAAQEKHHLRVPIVR
jgi:hypothetical protein